MTKNIKITVIKLFKSKTIMSLISAQLLFLNLISAQCSFTAIPGACGSTVTTLADPYTIPASDVCLDLGTPLTIATMNVGNNTGTLYLRSGTLTITGITWNAAGIAKIFVASGATLNITNALSGSGAAHQIVNRGTLVFGNTVALTSNILQTASTSAKTTITGNMTYSSNANVYQSIGTTTSLATVTTANPGNICLDAGSYWGGVNFTITNGGGAPF